jgi:iron complex transport system permease protein
VSGSAALGAVIALQTGFAASFALALPTAGLAGALIAVLLDPRPGGASGRSLTLILAGIAISALAGALTSLVLNLSPNPFAVSETVFWMLGSLADRSFWHVGMAAALHGTRLGPSDPDGARARRADAGRGRGGLARYRVEPPASDDRVRHRERRGRGDGRGGRHRVRRSRRAAILRPFLGARPALLLPASALGGAALVLAADIAVRLSCPTAT